MKYKIGTSVTRSDVAEKVGFEPTGPVKGLLDFEEGERRKSQAYRDVLACRFR